jgi:general L-amino acid transport system substrate-binding protein
LFEGKKMTLNIRAWVSVALGAALVSGLATAANGQSTLELVKKRGVLQCGISQIAPGFSHLNDRGRRIGFDIDICRAIAAAVLGDSEKVEFTPLDTNVRFQAVQSGRVDLLSSQTTWTFTRDASLGLDFGPVVFHDGQGIMVRADLGVKSASELSGAAICLLPGTTSLQNLEDYFRPRSLKYEAVVFENSDEWRRAFLAGRCDAITADRSVIVSVRSMANDPSRYLILPETIAYEPLAPGIRSGDAKWRDIVSWVIYALITAERKGVTSAQIGSYSESKDPEILRLLGASGDFGKMIALPNTWASNAIKAVGNYGEIFDRHFGPTTSMALDRGPNRLWTEGGLMFAPPFR